MYMFKIQYYNKNAKLPFCPPSSPNDYRAQFLIVTLDPSNFAI